MLPTRMDTPCTKAINPMSGAVSIARTGSLGMCFTNRSAAQRYRVCHSAIRSASLISPFVPLIARAMPARKGGCLNNTLTLINADAAVA